MTGYAWTAVAALLVFSPVAANAQQKGGTPLGLPNLMKGTPEEEAACAPDSARFCKRFEPDAIQVLGCLQRNRQQISKACQSVLRARGV
ncbi:hypothetical protein [Pseudorhodoplanes sp.]|uniref:hypothetical protein n=1 Tax=Pseudorhodoplanes sp. TaxID=1934341 RepID=UPI0039199F33